MAADARRRRPDGVRRRHRARTSATRGSSYRIGAPTAPFVIEGDEYDSAFFDKTAKFLKYLPDIAVINNIEFDHADIYDDLDAVRLAFRRLVNLVPRRGLTLLGADSPDAAALAPQALEPRADVRHRRGRDWRATDIARAARATHVSRAGSTRRDRGDVHGAAARRAQRAQRAGGDRRRPRVRRRRSTRCARASRRFSASSGGSRSSARAATSSSTTTSRIIRRRWPRRWRRCARRSRDAASGRSSSRARPRRAGACFRTTSRARSRAADQVVIASVFRSTLPPEERLSEDQLVARSPRARASPRGICPTSTRSSARSSAEARAGDLVVVMSNGGFGGIHRKLLEALAMKVRWSGDTMLLVELEQVDRSGRSTRARFDLAARLRARLGRAVRDIVPVVLLASAFTSIRC